MFNKILEVFPKTTEMQACPRQAYGAWALPVELQPEIPSHLIPLPPPGHSEEVPGKQHWTIKYLSLAPWYPEPAVLGPAP